MATQQKNTDISPELNFPRHVGDSDAAVSPSTGIAVEKGGETANVSARAGTGEKFPRNKQWEKRLLDLTYKNALLNFTGRHSLHLYAAGPDELFEALLARGMKLRASEECPPFGFTLKAQERKLALIEERQGVLRASGEIHETATRLLRRNRVASEETGTEILYLAFGFLQYNAKEGGKTLYAPLVLAPVRLTRTRSEFTLSLSEREYSVNATLLAFLKQEFGIDIRGLDGVSTLKISQILGTVRAEIASLQGWDVLSDVYLSAFSFKNYLMWHDLRTSMDEFRKNALVSALLEGKPLKETLPALSDEDEANPAATLLPLPSDSSQYSAVALSSAGVSFVLHGPPGTGKSQTIANMIANALASGKRVLFVAEKKAALDVVKKRLDQIGIGDFSLELHSNKTDKSDVLRRLERTLSLSGGEAENLTARSDELMHLREELKAPLSALHKRHGLGISVYEAILTYLENKNAPDVLDIESTFYDSLTAEKLASCRSAIRSAAAAAKECGGVFRSPFENVNLTKYSQGLRDKIFCASEVLIAEIKHFRATLGLFLEFYRQKVSVVTMRKIALFLELAKALGGRQKYFHVSESEFQDFFHANKKLDELLAYYSTHFRIQIELSDVDALREYCAVGGDWRLSRVAKAAVKKLGRAALHPLEEEDIPKFLETVLAIAEEEERVLNTTLAEHFSERGRINHKKRAEFLSELYRLHALAAEAFHDFHPDTFNAMCVRAQSGCAKPVLEGLLRAAEAFEAARRAFLDVTNAREILPNEDILDYYTAKAGALIDNIDMLANWCAYRATAERLASCGLTFISEALECGRLKTENVLAGFEKNVAKNFLELTIPLDASLSSLTVGTLEEKTEKFRLASEAFRLAAREHVRAKLISRLPKENELCGEVAYFTRLAKSNLRGKGLRWLFSQIPELSARLSPCMLMSPVTVAQYLEPQANMFDLVIFDEASQMNTAEAIGAIARAKSAIVVGDPKQLPPTAFFHSTYLNTENPECDDLESVLDDCLALGMPQRRLTWHYRSKHESLIAFSNATYYENRLCTFPSPDALESRVHLRLVEGEYERGGSKRNRGEAEALVREVVRRLEDPVLARASMGIVTFSTAQQEEIERLLYRELSKRKLETLAYEREEPLFVKNLENVQGDERDVILFSVCYGPDGDGKLSLNFGPLNQAGGSRRLNVAVSRAREEMLVFSTMTAGMLDLSKTVSRGVAGLKAFLSYAESGPQALAVRSAGMGIGRHIAREIEKYGYECRCKVGASDFKIDVCVIDPENPNRFLLGILSDGLDRFSVKDRAILQPETLKRGNWNIAKINSVSYYSNPKREIKRIKEILDRLTGKATRAGDWLMKYAKAYRAVKGGGAEVAGFITDGEHDAEILSRMREIVSVEAPISRAFLKKRVLASFGITKSGEKLEKKLDVLIDGAGFLRERVMGTDYFYKSAQSLRVGKFRTEKGAPIRREESDFTVFEMLSFVKGALESRVALYMDELVSLAHGVFRGAQHSERFTAFLSDCVSYGEEKGIFVRSASDRVSLA